MGARFGFDKNPLHLACALGDQQRLKELIANDAEDLFVVIEDRGSTLLHIAAEYGHVSIMEILLKTKAVEHILTPDHEGDTPIHIATNNIDVFGLLYNKFLSQKHQMHVDDLLNNKERTLLHYAAGKGAVEVVRVLLAEKANKCAGDSYGATPFHFAARCGSIPAMKELMGDDVDFTDKTGRTALHYASWNGQKEAVEWLLDKKASLSKADANGDTALHWAARSYRSPTRSEPSEVLYTLLMKPDADVFAENKAGQLPLSLALDKPKGAAIADIVKQIRSAMEKSHSLRHRHSIFMALYKDGASLLHYAAAYGQKEDVDWFFQEARNVTVRKKDGKASNFEAIANSKDTDGNNPFHWAAMNGNSLVIEALWSWKVDPLSKNNEDKTPFLLALINNHLDFARNLGKCLDKDLTDPMWLEDLRTWTDAFIDERLILAFKLHMRKFIFMPGGLQDRDIKKEMPFTYKALYAKKDEVTTNFIQKISNVNKAGKLTGRTALHWATILNQKEIVFRLCKQYEKDLVAFVGDKEGKTPLDYATHSEILRALLKRPDVKSYERKHYRDIERYVSACNAILVSAALIVNVTFGGWLHPPWNHIFEYDHRFGALRIFWIFNGSSFFFAIATVVAAASALLPAPYQGISEGVSSIRISKSLFYAAALLVISMVFVFCAFAAASFVVLPRSSKSIKLMIWGIASGALLGSYLLWRSVHGLYMVYSRPSSPEAQPAKSELHESRPSSPQSDARDPYKLGTRYEYLPWDDGLDGGASSLTGSAA